MKKKIILIMLMCSLFIISSLIGILFIKDVNADYTDDIEYTFDNSIWYDTTTFPNDYLFNVRNQTIITQNYIGSYTETIGLIGENIDFVDKDWFDISSIIDNHSNHNEVLQLNALSNSPDIEHNIEQTIGSIDFWVFFEKNTKRHSFTFQENPGAFFQLKWEVNGDLYYWGVSEIFIEAYSSGVWYHIRIDFDISTDWHLWINGISKDGGSGYAFYNNPTIINEVNIEIVSIEKVYIDAWAESWESTYDFDDDIIGNEPINWITNNDDDCNTKIIDSLDDNLNVLKIYDNNNNGMANISKAINQQNDQTIEFDIAKSSIEAYTESHVIFKVDNIKPIKLMFVGNDLYYWYGYAVLIKSDCFIANNFYRIKIILDDTNKRFDLYINNILEGNNLDYYYIPDNSINIIEFSSHIQWFGYSFYIDNIFISSNPGYKTNENLIPLIETNSNIKEVNRYEFGYESFYINYSIGYDNPSGWTDIEPADDWTNIAIDYNDIYDRTVKMEKYSAQSLITGLERNFTTHTNILNITWSVNFTTWESTREFNIKIYSYDKTLILNIILENYQIKYDDGSKTVLGSGLSINKRYDFNLYINYNDDISILYYYENEVYQDTFYWIPLIDSTKEGLGSLEFYIDDTPGNDMILYLDYIGIYVKGSSISKEFAFVRNDDMKMYYDWYYTQYNLFSFNINGNMSYHLSENWCPDTPITTSQICPLDLYTEYILFNLYDFTHKGLHSQNAPILWIQFYKQLQIENFSTSIEGIMMKEGSNHYHLEFTHNGIYPNKSYFYVDSYNRLCFNLEIDDDDILEFIQAKFNINNLLLENRSIAFNSYFNGHAIASIRTFYTSIKYDNFSVPNGYSSTNIILPQNENIQDFRIIISDNNNNKIYGNSTGYITHITLNYYPSIGLTLFTLSLIEIMIPLIILLIPTLAIASIYGKKAIIPMLILMSIICYITVLIPLEIFLVMIFALGSSLFIQYKKRSEVI